jgi:hypothetical protein
MRDWDLVESPSRFRFSAMHNFFGKPRHAFPDHAPARKFLQQPEGGETPGVAAAPVALAGGAMVGLARSIEMLSLHAAVFGVAMAVVAGLMLVSASSSPAIGD